MQPLDFPSLRGQSSQREIEVSFTRNVAKTSLGPWIVVEIIIFCHLVCHPQEASSLQGETIHKVAGTGRYPLDGRKGRWKEGREEGKEGKEQREGQIDGWGDGYLPPGHTVRKYVFLIPPTGHQRMHKSW